jgi:uncharacterized protein RhaS with RHS repeats
METLDLELPLYLYTETTDPQGAATRITYTADKLVAWADGGRGDAIEKLCLQIYYRDVEVVRAWQEHQYLLLEETWAAIENGVDDAENENQYTLACDAVGREADEKCDVAGVRMEERKVGLVKLVQQSKDHIAANKPATQESSSSGYLLLLVAASVLAYVLLS